MKQLPSVAGAAVDVFGYLAAAGYPNRSLSLGTQFATLYPDGWLVGAAAAAAAATSAILTVLLGGLLTPSVIHTDVTLTFCGRS